MTVRCLVWCLLGMLSLSSVCIWSSFNSIALTCSSNRRSSRVLPWKLPIRNLGLWLHVSLIQLSRELGLIVTGSILITLLVSLPSLTVLCRNLARSMSRLSELPSNWSVLSHSLV